MKNKKSLFPAANRLASVTSMSNVILARRNLAAYLGRSFSGDRNLYTSCGYPTTLTYQHFYEKFVRGDIAKRIVLAYPNSTWRQEPEVYEVEDLDVETEFERIWNGLVKSKRIFNYLRRIDISAGIGQYGVLLLGFADGRELDQELIQGSGRRLLYMRPYSQANASIEAFEKDSTNERYGLPTMYKLKTVSPGTNSTNDFLVHWSRVIHVAQGLLEDDVYGTPVLEAVYNRLQDIEFILGGSAEMHWKMGFPGLNFKADPEYDFGAQEKSDLEDEVEKYVNGLKRYMKLQGIDVQQLTPQGIDSTPLITTELQFISGTMGIPIRILIGSERGELASSQDDKNWNSRVDERRKSVGENTILRPFIDRLQFAGILPEIEEVLVDWPDIGSPSELEKAEISVKRMQALQAYSNAVGAQDIYPPDKFLENEMRLNPDEILEINDALELQMKEEEVEPLSEINPNQGDD